MCITKHISQTGYYNCVIEKISVQNFKNVTRHSVARSTGLTCILQDLSDFPSLQVHCNPVARHLQDRISRIYYVHFAKFSSDLGQNEYEIGQSSKFKIKFQICLQHKVEIYIISYLNISLLRIERCISVKWMEFQNNPLKIQGENHIYRKSAGFY